MSSTTVARCEPSSRSRYQSIRALMVSSSSRWRAFSWSWSSTGTTRRRASTTASSGDRSGKPRGGGSPFVPVENSSHQAGASPSGGRVVCRLSVIGSSLESNAQRTVLELGPPRAVRGHRGREDDSPLLRAYPDDHLEADLLQLDVGLLDERDGEPERGRAVVRDQLLRQVVV